jgi:hypothetical protein
MQPQGTALVNTAFFTSQIAAIEAAPSCVALALLQAAMIPSVEAEITAVNSQIAALAALIAVPTDLPSVITWITNMIAPMLVMHTNAISQATLLMAKQIALEAAIAARAAQLGCI